MRGQERAPGSGPRPDRSATPPRLPENRHDSDTPTNIVVSAGLVVRPGDTLVIGYPAEPEMESTQAILAAFRETMPDVRVVIVTGTDQLAVVPGADNE